MVVNIDAGRRLGYYFRYEGDETRCVVYDPQSHKELAHGHTSRFHKDTPNRAIARKQAFASSMRVLPLGKAERAVMWKHFLSSVRWR